MAQGLGILDADDERPLLLRDNIEALERQTPLPRSTVLAHDTGIATKVRPSRPNNFPSAPAMLAPNGHSYSREAARCQRTRRKPIGRIPSRWRFRKTGSSSSSRVDTVPSS